MTDENPQQPDAPFSGDNQNDQSQQSGYSTPGAVPIPPPPTAQQYYGNNVYGYGYSAPNDGNAVLALVLGILGLTGCAIVAPAAWIIGAKSRSKIKSSNGALGGDGLALAGMICGIVGTAILAFTLLYFIFFFFIIGLSAL